MQNASMFKTAEPQKKPTDNELPVVRTKRLFCLSEQWFEV